MPRTDDDIDRSVDIAVVDMTAITASPPSYSKVCDTERPRIRKASTARTDLGGKALIHFLVLRAMLNSLVREHRAEARPGGVVYGLGHPGPGHACGIDIPYRDEIEFVHDAVRELVQKILTGMHNFRVGAGDEAFLPCPLRVPKFLLEALIGARVRDLLSCGEDRELL